MVTRALSRDVALPHTDRPAVLITLDNGQDHTRPNTLGPRGLAELNAALDTARARDDISAILVTGKPFILAAGADLSAMGLLSDREQALAIARIGHAVLGKLHDAPVPTFALINGMALGGGLEVTLHCDYRTVSAAAAGIALPECFLGLVPGWGGAFLVPNLIGIEGAVTLVLQNPLSQNRMLDGKAAYALGLADAMFDGADFLERSLDWAGQVVSGTITVERAPVDRDADRWDAVLADARAFVDAKVGGAAPAPYRALELLAAARTADRAAAFAAEDEALADLIMSRGASGQPVRVRPGPQARPQAGRGAGSLAGPSGDQGGCGRGRPDGQPAGHPVPAPAAGAAGDQRPRPGAGRPRTGRDFTPRSTSSWPSSGSRPTRPTGCARWSAAPRTWPISPTATS